MRPILFVDSGLGLQDPQLRRDDPAGLLRRAGDRVWRARRERIDPNVVYELATWLFLGGVVGARGVYVLSHLESIHSLGDIFRSWQGGNNFYGCILGGLTGSILYWFRRPFPFWLMTDVAAPAVAIGNRHRPDRLLLERLLLRGGVRPALGRLLSRRVARLGSPGRRRLDSADWAIIRCRCIPRRSTRRSPGLPCSACCWRISRAAAPPGEVMAVLMIVYPLTRWPLEAVRGDEPAIFAGMTLSQNISVALFACGLAVWIWLRTSCAVHRRDGAPVAAGALACPFPSRGSALGLALAPGRAGGAGE